MGDQQEYGATAFQADTGVSRETLERLEIYAALLRQWQPRVNLVSSTTLDDLWRRHFLDSAQLAPLVPESARSLADMGSGAGFPGLVLAILGAPEVHLPEVHLIESDQRKVAFLRTVAAATGVPVTIHARRIEAVPALFVDVVTARALAPLASLVGYGLPLLRPKGVCLFLKGQQAERELAAAAERWQFIAERLPSRSDSSGVILRLSEIVPHRRPGDPLS